MNRPDSQATSPPLPSEEGAKPGFVDPRIEALEAAVTALTERVRHLESHLFPGARLGPATVPDMEGPAPGRPDAEAESFPVFALAARAFLALGGAFFIRALTEGGTFPKGGGVLLGGLYALGWAALALRASAYRAPANLLLSATMALPLLLESATRFAVLPPAVAAAILPLLGALYLGVAWRRDLHPSAWIITLATLLTGFVLMIRADCVLPVTAAFLALGTGVLWLTYGRRWHGLRWPTALSANLATLILTTLAAWPGGPPEAHRGLSMGWSLTLSLGLVVAYGGSIAVRTLQKNREVNAFEVAQTLMALGVGFGGAVRVALASGSALIPFGAVALATGAASYAVAFAFLEKQRQGSRNFFFFTSLSILFVLIGAGLILSGGPLATALAIMASLTLALGLRQHRWILLAHAAVYFSTAAVALDLPNLWALAFLGPPSQSPGLSPFGPLLLTLVLAGAHGFASQGRPEGTLPAWKRLPSFALVLWAALGISGLALTFIERFRPFSDAGTLAATRTLVLGALAVASALVSRWWPGSEARWLVHPVLIGTGLKILLEDLPKGRPSTLFLSFTAFGLALAFAPRLMGKGPRPG